MTPEEALRRSHEARRLMDDPLLKEALSLIERDVTEMWLAIPVRDVEGREAAWRMAVTARKFKDMLQGTMEAGKLAEEQIRQKEQSAMQKVKNIVRRY